MKHSKRLFKSLFYVPKYEKVSEKSLSRIMLSSVFGILLCGICLAGLTWAWFTGSVSSTANTITAAKFTVDISVIEEGATTPLSPTEENGAYIYALDTDKTYTVTVKASGSATTGYCTVKLGSDTYHTIQLYYAGGEGKPKSVDFTVNASDGSPLVITPQWGTFGITAGESLIGNGLSGIPTTETNTKPQASVSAVSPEAMTTAEASEQSAGTESANTPTGTVQTATTEEQSLR